MNECRGFLTEESIGAEGPHESSGDAHNLSGSSAHPKQIHTCGREVSLGELQLVCLVRSQVLGLISAGHNTVPTFLAEVASK
jgi:hypothetical protein